MAPHRPPFTAQMAGVAAAALPNSEPATQLTSKGSCCRPHPTGQAKPETLSKTDNVKPSQAPVPLKAVSYDRSEIMPTRKRYLILLLFCLHSMINAAQWIYLSSITATVARFFRVDNMAVNWTSMVYMVVYIPLVVPASWLFERLGMRHSVLVGSLGTTIGSLIKCFACEPGKFYLLMVGQTLVAISQLFVLSVPPRLASIWFPDDQVSLATACGVFGNQLGIALGFLVPQWFVGDHATGEATVQRGLWTMFVFITVLSVSVSSLIALLFDETPERAPGIARLLQMKQEAALAVSGITPLVNGDLNETGPASSPSSGADSSPTTAPTQISNYGFHTLLWAFCTDRNFVLLVVSYGLNVGVFYAISTVLNQMIAPYWPHQTNELVARLGLVMIVAGMFGSMLAGFVLDKTHRYRLVNVFLYGASLASMLLFTGILELRNSTALSISVALLGFFMTGYLLIGYELSNEITWPRPESVAAGLLNLSAQFFGILLTYAGSFIVDNRGNYATNAFFSIALLVGLLVTSYIKAQLKRQSAVTADD